MWTGSPGDSTRGTVGCGKRGCRKTLPTCCRLHPGLFQKPGGWKEHSNSGHTKSCMPFSSLASLMEGICSLSQFIFPFSAQQNIVKKEHHVSELDVNQKGRGSGEILVQIIGQTFLSCIKKSHKDQYLQKPEFHYPLKEI